MEKQAYIGYINTYNRIFELDTAARVRGYEELPHSIVVPNVGTIQFIEKSTSNSMCGQKECPDLWVVTGVPDGYFVSPESIVIDEHEKGEFYVFPFNGS